MRLSISANSFHFHAFYQTYRGKYGSDSAWNNRSCHLLTPIVVGQPLIAQLNVELEDIRSEEYHWLTNQWIDRVKTPSSACNDKMVDLSSGGKDLRYTALWIHIYWNWIDSERRDDSVQRSAVYVFDWWLLWEAGYNIICNLGETTLKYMNIEELSSGGQVVRGWKQKWVQDRQKCTNQKWRRRDEKWIHNYCWWACWWIWGSLQRTRESLSEICRPYWHQLRSSTAPRVWSMSLRVKWQP